MIDTSREGKTGSDSVRDHGTDSGVKARRAVGKGEHHREIGIKPFADSNASIVTIVFTAVITPYSAVPLCFSCYAMIPKTELSLRNKESLTEFLLHDIIISPWN